VKKSDDQFCRLLRPRRKRPRRSHTTEKRDELAASRGEKRTLAREYSPDVASASAR